jgi:hypothetical protein
MISGSKNLVYQCHLPFSRLSQPFLPVLLNGATIFSFFINKKLFGAPPSS